MDAAFRATATLLLAAGFGITALIYAPVAWLALLSVSADPLSGWPGGLTTSWYASLSASLGWRAPMLRSLGIAGIVAILCVLAAVPPARAWPRMRRGRAGLAALILLPLGAPGIVVGLLVFTTWRVLFGAHMGAWSLVLSHFIWAYPFALISMLVVTLRTDPSLAEAARDLGASHLRVLFDIELPALMPGIVGAGLFGFLLSFTELPRSIFTGGQVQTLPLYSFAQASAHSSQIKLIFCLNTLISLVSLAAAAALVVLLRRRPA